MGTQPVSCASGQDICGIFFQSSNVNLGEGVLAAKNTVIANHYVYNFVNLSSVFS